MSMRVSPRKQVTSQAKPPAVLDIGRFNVQTMAAAITASAAATTCAGFDWPVWAMLLGWVASLTGGRSLKDVFRSYVCLAAGISIGTAATLAIGEPQDAVARLEELLDIGHHLVTVVVILQLHFQLFGCLGDSDAHVHLIWLLSTVPGGACGHLDVTAVGQTA